MSDFDKMDLWESSSFIDRMLAKGAFPLTNFSEEERQMKRAWVLINRKNKCEEDLDELQELLLNEEVRSFVEGKMKNC